MHITWWVVKIFPSFLIKKFYSFMWNVHIVSLEYIFIWTCICYSTAEVKCIIVLLLLFQSMPMYAKLSRMYHECDTKMVFKNTNKLIYNNIEK